MLNGLDGKNIKWNYEPKRFVLSTEELYTPDFYLPKRNLYVEIKGRWFVDDRRRYDLFCSEYSDLEIIVIMAEQLRKRGIEV